MAISVKSYESVIGLDDFLRDYPLMAVRPAAGRSEIILTGIFAFTAECDGHGEITDKYRLRIEVPREFPKEVPIVTELERKIPRREGFHVNPDDTLCLGSPLRLLLKLSTAPTLVGFTELCLVPYLFAISFKLAHGGTLVFSELAHGMPGMLADYMDLFRLDRPEKAAKTLQLLGKKKRAANKYPCPCGCGLRLGKCRFNRHLKTFRTLASRTFYRSQALDSEQGLIQLEQTLSAHRNLVRTAAAQVIRVQRGSLSVSRLPHAIATPRPVQR